MARRGIQSEGESESDGWICNNPACLRYFSNISRWTRHLARSVVECNNGTYNRVRLNVYLRGLAEKGKYSVCLKKNHMLTRPPGAATAHALRAARMQEEAEQLQQHTQNNPTQEHASHPDAVHTSDQSHIVTSPASNLPVEQMPYNGVLLPSAPPCDAPLQDITSNVTFSDITFNDIPISTMPFNYESPGDVSYGWTNWDTHPADGVFQQPNTEPSADNQPTSR